MCDTMGTEEERHIGDKLRSKLGQLVTECLVRCSYMFQVPWREN